MAKSSAFDLSNPKGQWTTWDDLANWIANELDLAQSGRSGVASEIKFCWSYYEQARMRGGNMPWPDAADLPSPYAPEYTDALQARLMQTIFVDPVWTVEGWGASAKQAPFVEEFHQRAQEDERLQTYADEWVLRGLIEGVGTLEVSEATEMRREQVRKRIALKLGDDGLPMHGEQGPMLATDEDGEFIEPPPDDEATPSAEVQMDELQPVRVGPDYEVIPYLDFYTLPHHARHQKQIWGYAKRFWIRYVELKAGAKKGLYDKAAVEAIGTEDTRTNITEEAPQNLTPVDQRGPTAQKELFSCQLLLDLDGKGERWWRVTLDKEKRKLLRCLIDDRTTRYIRWMPFPKPGNVDRGYSLIGNKLITVIEQDTALRNMAADRMALKVGQPIKRRTGALWDPYEQPFGPRAVIDVRDMDEVQAMQGIEDVPASIQYERSAVRADADRLVGQNDTSIGTQTDESRTLGEVQLRAGYAEVRINLITKRMQEPMEELFLARHVIWKRTLQSNQGLGMQRAMVVGRGAQGVDANGVSQDTTITAEMLEGIYWGKPRGSVENADLQRAQGNFIGLMQSLAQLMPVFPMMGMVMNTPPATKAVIEEMLRVFRWPDKQSFLGAQGAGVFEAMQQQHEQQMAMQQIQSDPRMQVLLAAAGGGAPTGDGGPMAAPQPPTATGPTGVQ